VKLITECKMDESASLVEDILNEKSFQFAYKKSEFVTLRVLVLYASWRDGSSVMEFSERTSDDSGEAMALAEEIWTCFKRKRSSIPWKCISAYFIQCHVTKWLGYDDEVLEIAEEAVDQLEQHADAHLLRAAVDLTQPGTNDATTSLLSCLRCNPHEGNLLSLLNAVAEQENEKAEWTVEKLKGLLVHLDTCHPDLQSVKHCIKQWKKLLLVLQSLETSDFDDPELSSVLHRELESRSKWWRKYFFSTFSARSLLKSKHQDVQKLLCILGQVSCYLYGSDNPYLAELISQLNSRHVKKLRKTQKITQVRNSPILSVSVQLSDTERS